jgi:hypothetical protein
MGISFSPVTSTTHLQGYTFVICVLLQLPVDQYQTINPERKFVKWHAPALGAEPARDYWTLTQFYVPEGKMMAIIYLVMFGKDVKLSLKTHAFA